MWFRIAVRNLLKNRRRSLSTVLAIAIGYAAVNVFGGFSEYIFQSLQDSVIYAQGNGHLTIFKKGFLTHGKVDPLKFILSREEQEQVRALLVDDSRILLVTSQLYITGLISNGRAATVFLGIGKIPSDLEFMQKSATGMMAKIIHYDGKRLQDDIPYGVGMSGGLARKLKLELGAEGVVMSPTVGGQINALDIQVINWFNSPVEELEDKLVLVPLPFAQSLYNTTSVDRINVLLKSDEYTNELKDRLASLFDKLGLELEIKAWQDLSAFHTKVKGMFRVIFLFVFVIVVVIVVMNVINTMSMSILERTREIGTLRALGLKRRGVVGLLGIESAVLGITGCSLGLLLTLGSWLLVRWLEPTWVPPHIVRRIPLEVYIVPHYLCISFVSMLTLTIGTSLVPTRRAAGKGIVEALGHA
jgi:putative ABC transport system permease protein